MTNGIHDLVGGMCQTDYSGYPDCRRVFVDSMQTALSLALDEDLRIHTPLMYLNKAETWKLAAELNIVDVVREAQPHRLQRGPDYVERVGLWKTRQSCFHS